MSRHVVAPTGDIPPGNRKLFVIKGRPIAIFNLGGEYFGLLNRCPHQGGSLCDGVVDRPAGIVASPGHYTYSRQGEIVRCPWHGWEFDIRTGQSYCDPERIRTKAYEVAARIRPERRRRSVTSPKPCRCRSRKTISWSMSDGGTPAPTLPR